MEDQLQSRIASVWGMLLEHLAREGLDNDQAARASYNNLCAAVRSVLDEYRKNRAFYHMRHQFQALDILLNELEKEPGVCGRTTVARNLLQGWMKGDEKRAEERERNKNVVQFGPYKAAQIQKTRK